MEIAESSLASALEGFYVTVSGGTSSYTSRVDDPDETARVLFATLSRMAALREPQDGDVVDAHICCEHADDRELSVMADIVRLMEAGTLDGHAVIRALYPLDGPELVRVLRWLLARFPADPPF